MTQPSDPQPPIADKAAEFVRKVIVPGGVTAGGIGAFWSLLVKDDLGQAIASAVIGLGLSYGARLMSPIHQGNERRITEAGKAIDARIDQITKSMIAGATGFENKYLLCQALECQAFRSEGLAQRSGIFVPLLREVFVPLSLDLNSNAPGYREFSPEQLEGQVLREQSIWNYLAEGERVRVFRQLAILAWGGYGKTTLLKHIAYLYGTQQAPKGAPRLIPILIVLREHKDRLAAGALSLPALIEQHHVPHLAGSGGLKVPAGWAESLLTRGRALVMFDGFDEVEKSRRPAVAGWMNQQMRQYERSRFIVTSRPKAYQQQSPVNALALTSSVWVNDFGKPQRRKFVEKWYQCQERYANGGRTTPDVEKVAKQSAQELLIQIESEPDLRSLAKNPLLLNMITTFHRRYPGKNLPNRRTELYQEICQLQLKDRPATRRLDTLLVECEPQIILQEIAMEMMQRRSERIERNELLPLTQQILDRQGESIDAEELIKQIVEISELLVQQEDEYEFAHLSFQEYLAAAHVATAPEEREPLLYERIPDEKWKDVLLLYAGKARKPTPLIREVLRQGNQDLAYACLQQTTRRVDAALRAELEGLVTEVQNALYADLEKYLKNKDWKAADRETYRLMITEVGKEEGQWLEPEDLLNFPCEPLRTIDGLWVKHSEGRFGFSVQKDLYLKCGGIADGQYHKEAWQKFCETNGWMKSGRHQDLKYEGGVPEGHLPGFWTWRKIRPADLFDLLSLVSLLLSLFSRIQTCKL